MSLGDGVLVSGGISEVDDFLRVERERVGGRSDAIDRNGVKIVSGIACLSIECICIGEGVGKVSDGLRVE